MHSFIHSLVIHRPDRARGHAGWKLTTKTTTKTMLKVPIYEDSLRAVYKEKVLILAGSTLVPELQDFRRGPKNTKTHPKTTVPTPDLQTHPAPNSRRLSHHTPLPSSSHPSFLLRLHLISPNPLISRPPVFHPTSSTSSLSPHRSFYLDPSTSSLPPLLYLHALNQMPQRIRRPAKWCRVSDYSESVGWGKVTLSYCDRSFVSAKNLTAQCAVDLSVTSVARLPHLCLPPTFPSYLRRKSRNLGQV